MTISAQHRRYTVSEYLRLEYDATERHEYRDGEIVAMAGGSLEHSRIIASIIREMGNALKGKSCSVFDSNLRVRILRTPLYTYPDALVICGQPQYDQNDPRSQTVINPILVAEVLSPTTEGYDRGEKFWRYRQLESLREYVLLSQDAPRVETFFRQPDGTWLLNTFAGLDAHVRFASLSISLSLAEIYAGVQFPPSPSVPV